MSVISLYTVGLYAVNIIFSLMVSLGFLCGDTKHVISGVVYFALATGFHVYISRTISLDTQNATILILQCIWYVLSFALCVICRCMMLKPSCMKKHRDDRVIYLNV